MTKVSRFLSLLLHSYFAMCVCVVHVRRWRNTKRTRKKKWENSMTQKYNAISLDEESRNKNWNIQTARNSLDCVYVYLSNAALQKCVSSIFCYSFFLPFYTYITGKHKREEIVFHINGILFSFTVSVFTSSFFSHFSNCLVILFPLYQHNACVQRE